MLRTAACIGIIVSSGLMASVAVVGCTAQGSSDDYVPELAVTVEAGRTDPTPISTGEKPDDRPDTGTDTVRDASADARPDSGRDASTDGATKPDAAPDSGSTSPIPGAACTNGGQVFERACGFCGLQQSACETDGAGGFVWSDYGRCDGQVEAEDRCMPGTAQDNDCGLCGKSGDICQRDCHWGRGACREPVNACTPDSVKYITASCMELNEYRMQLCSETCEYGAASPPPCGPREIFVNITRAKGYFVTGEGVIEGAINRVNGGSGVTACTPLAEPDGQVIAANQFPYTYFEIRNPHDKAAKVEISFAPSFPAGITNMSIFSAIYPGAMPMDNASRATCAKTATCYSSGAPWACFPASQNVVIPAHGKIFVYAQPTSRPSNPAPVKYLATVTTLSFE